MGSNRHRDKIIMPCSVRTRIKGRETQKTITYKSTEILPNDNPGGRCFCLRTWTTRPPTVSATQDDDVLQGRLKNVTVSSVI